MEKQYISRLFDKQLDFYLKCVGAIQIVGPKWCGKSTTAKRHAKTIIDLAKNSEKNFYVPLAKESPDTLLKIGEKPILIDEWQIISFIWNDLKSEIDEGSSFGQYILTGSVTDNTIKNNLQGDINEQHTGTGRIMKRQMRTMSLFESGDSNGSNSLLDLKNGIFNPTINRMTLSDYAFLLCRGGWPLAIGKEKDVALEQVKIFYDGLVKEDIFSLNDIKLRKDFKRATKILRAYSRNISTQATNESLKLDLKSNGDKIDKDTFIKYLLVLERLYVVEELEAWNPNLRSKTAIREKNTRHFVDPSIAVAALNITPEGLLRDIRTFGLLFESMVIRDLRIYCDCIDARVYHYRDYSDREADAVIQFSDGNYALIGVKLTNSEDIDKAAKKLRILSDDIIFEGAKPSFLAIITATSTAYKREDGVYVIPLGCLKN